MEAQNSELGPFHPHRKAASFKLNSSKNQFGPCSESRQCDMQPMLQPTSLVFRRLESERAKFLCKASDNPAGFSSELQKDVNNCEGFCRRASKQLCGWRN